ncbi:hypothetical protein K502DRAFT_331124 [Neoconidiobolus thromboides FSU 785]|nr:hypothetical protein K502DRAFT_331124 [Neoconidiobolus thromboides FSU 785]
MVEIKKALSFISLFTIVTSLFCPTKDYCQVHIFGDSLSDYSNLYAYTNNTLPDNRYYFNGRYSNGRTWVEYLTESMKVKKVQNFAYAGATSDNVEFEPKLVKGGVPGAIQQVENYNKYYDQKEKYNIFRCRKSLIVFAFGGNDFDLPNSSPQKMMDNLDKALTTLIEKNGLTDFLLMVGSPLDYAPKIKLLPKPYQEQITKVAVGLEYIWNQLITKYKSKYNNLNIYTFNSRSYVADLINGAYILNNVTKWETEIGCLQRKFVNGTISSDTIRCSDPNNFIFWDELHPTTQVHKYVADQIFTKVLIN